MWIQTSEQLPEPLTDVLVVNGEYVDIAYKDGCSWVLMDGYVLALDQIEKWQPLDQRGE